MPPPTAPAQPASSPTAESAPDSPRTVGQWRDAALAGASPRVLLAPALARAAAAASEPAWILRLGADALESRLRELDAWLAQEPDPARRLARWPLFGVPFAVKDNIDVAGLPTTAACPAWARTAERSATVVHRLLAAGAVLLGKTNLDQFATGLVGTRSPYGAPASVFAAERISGGSSSGSAVAVARGEVAFALGTDTAGSGRVPAAFNALVGLKPTPGRVGTAGVLPACRTIDCVSVFAHDVVSAACVLSVIEGPDPDDPFSRFTPGPAHLPSPLRVGVPADALDALDPSLGYDTGWGAALHALAALGAQVVPIDFAPLHAVARMLYDGPWVAERYAVVQPLLDARPEALDPAVAAVVGRAREFSAVDTFRAQYALQDARQALSATWQGVDLLVVPSVPTHPRFADVAADPIGANAALGRYTNFVNLLGWSALALPAGTVRDGLPFGITAIGPGGADAALLDWGLRWEAHVAGGDSPPPATAGERPWPATRPTLPIAVVGAHMSGLPLNHELAGRGATLRERTTTAPRYRLYALPGTTPARPGLVRTGDDGMAIALEVWDLPLEAVGSFLAGIPSPLGIGSVELADGRRVHGFLCESIALHGALDVSRHGGWRAYLAAR